MRYLKSFLVACAALFAAACTPEEQPPVETPKEPAAPVIVSAQLKGVNGEAEIIAGNPVKFTASVTVENSELLDYTLEIKKDGAVIGSASGELTGTSATIEKELTLDVSAATLDAPFFPVVTLKVTNKDEMYAEKTLEEADNVKITTMELLDALWLVDNLGAAYQMSATDERGKYRTTASLEVIGTSFQIVSKVTEEGAVDPSGENYGTFNTPEAGEEGLYWIGYNVFTGELSKCLNLTHTLDYTKMANDGDYKVYWNATLVQDCRVVFLNYPEGIQLQADRWADVEGNTARYTGHTNEHWEIYYNPDANWLVLKEQYITTPSLWVTGENAGLPMSPYAGDFAFNWFGADVTNTNWWRSWDRATAVMKGENEWEILLYFKANFGIKLYYGAASWGAECAWTSTTPETLVISEVVPDPETGALDGNYGNAGPSFTEGLYTLKYNSATEEVSLVKYTGPTYGVAAGDKDPIAPEPEPEPEPEPDPEVPVNASLYLVDNNGKVWTMSQFNGTHYVTDEGAGEIGTSFTIAEKYVDGAIDQTGAVYGPFDLDASYVTYNKKPWKVGFDTATSEVIYREGIWKSGLGDLKNGTLVQWEQCLPQNCELYFFGFDKPIKELVNCAIFKNIDEVNCCARYIGVSDRYEVRYRVEQGWLNFGNEISSADNKYTLIGKNASFPQSPYTEFPIIESTIAFGDNSCQSCTMYKVAADVYRTQIYLANDFAFHVYAGYGWGDYVKGWTSLTEDVLVARAEGNFHYGVQNVNNAFTPGVYEVEFNKTNNTVALTLIKGDGQEPEPVGPPTALTLTDNNGKTWTMSQFNGTHFVTDEGAGEIGTSFSIAGDNGVNYGTYDLDGSYVTYNKKPWKVGFDIETNEVIYREGIWKSGLGDLKNGTLVQWEQCLPQNCELYLFGFDKPIKELVNCAIFKNIDEVNCCARYIGVSDRYEVRYRVEQGWLNFGNEISSADNKYTLIGKNASFPQSPYTEFPIIESTIAFGDNSCQSCTMYKVAADVYRTQIYLANDFAFHVYAGYGWGDYVKGWTSLTEDVLVARAEGNFHYGVQNVNNAFTPGVYEVEFNKANNTVALTKVNE